MEVLPVSPEWIHKFLVEPYLEGAERCNLAWEGHDYSLVPKQFSWQERAVYFLQGTSLLLFPFVNTIIWLSWQTFGSPERLADKFAHPFSPPRRARPLPDPIQIQNQDERAPNQVQIFSQLHKNGDEESQTDWKITYYPDSIVAEQNSDRFTNTALFTSDFQLKEIYYSFNEQHISLKRSPEEPNEIAVSITPLHGDTTNVSVRFEEDLPWIQQRIGLKNFIQSDDLELDFYAVIPAYPSWVKIPRLFAQPPYAMKIKAIKKEVEEVAGFGKLQKIEFSSTWGFPYSLARSEMWFDPESGLIQKYRDTAPFFEAIGTSLQNDQSPE